MYIPRYLILSDIHFIGNFFFSALSSSGGMCRPIASDFVLFTLKFESVPNSSSVSNRFFNEVSRLVRESKVSSANSDTLYMLFPIGTPSIPWFSRILEANTSMHKANNIGESGHPCLVPLETANGSDV
ncbi:hypothetical protein FKM82_018552 [Ascaphus truei]